MQLQTSSSLSVGGNLANTNEDSENWLKEYCDTKLCLELGLPISYLNEYKS